MAFKVARARLRAGAKLVVCALAAQLAFGAPAPTPVPSGQEAPLSRDSRIVRGLAEPLIASAATSAVENAALEVALQEFAQAASSANSAHATRRFPTSDFADQAAPLEAFLVQYPRSPWRTSLLTNLGLGYYASGYFSKAMASWRLAWEAGRSTASGKAESSASPSALAVKALSERALGELARMQARLGRADDLQELFNESEGRVVAGPATELMTGAREALWNFRNDYARSYLCGPMALRNLLVASEARASRVELVSNQKSGPLGFSLRQLSTLADRAGISHRIVFRQPGQAIPVPSVVHWKLDHYAAIVAFRDGRYLVQDPTFASGDTWLTPQAIDHEASGYFLVPKSMAPAALSVSSEPVQDKRWRVASADEARRVYGKGQTSNSEEGNTTPDDPPCDKGMCRASAKLMLVSLTLTDTPVGYTPPKGPPVNIRLSYNQRESGQPAVFGFFNISPKWSMNVLSWIEDDPNQPGAGVVRHVAGGGWIGPYDYLSSQYNTTTGTFGPERRSGAVLARLPALGPAASYELRMPDGSLQVFAQSDGATSRPRRIFLSRVVDPAGNALRFNYDGQLRLVSITDATGRDTRFSYDASASPLLVSRITDPFGRHADLTYDSQGRLASITDVIGITSAFSYDAAGLVNAMTTPYGTSHFDHGQSTAINGRYLEITDPLGLTERIEFRHGAPGVSSTEAAPAVAAPTGNHYLQYRNTFHWDKHAHAVAGGQYGAARITHWLHNPSGLTSPIVESTKAPLESRVWYQYPGQSGSGYFEGSSGLPAQIGRVLGDGRTQLVRFSRNAWGKPATVMDAAGRLLRLTYADNGIDVLSVQREGPAGGAEVVARYTYDHRHLPLSRTDAAGQTTRYTYDSAGLLASETNPLGETTRYSRDSFGRLVGIMNPDGSMRERLSYDPLDHVASRTDSEGYTRTFQYDALDRVIRVGYPDGTSTGYTYERLDLVAVKDRLGRLTRYAWDANRRLTSVTDPLGQVTAYTWHRNGALESVTDPKGQRTRWDIDLQGRHVAKHHADGGIETYAWNASGQIASITDAQGRRRQFDYTVDGRIEALTYSGLSTVTPAVRYAWDPIHPRVVSMSDGNGQTLYAYHPAGGPGGGQVASVASPVAGGGVGSDTVQYDYDALGRVVQRRISGVDAEPENISYDALGRIGRQVNSLGAFGYDYVGAGERVSSINATAGPQVALSYYGSDGDLRLREIAYRTANGRPLAGYGYRYDAEGNVIEFADALADTRLGGFSESVGAPGSPGGAGGSQAGTGGVMKAASGGDTAARPAIAARVIAAVCMALLGVFALWPLAWIAVGSRWRCARRWVRLSAPVLALSLAASCGGGSSGTSTSVVWWPGEAGGGSGSGTAAPNGPGAAAQPTARLTRYSYDGADRLTQAVTALDLPGAAPEPVRGYEWDAASNLIAMSVGESTRKLPAAAANALAEGQYDADGNPLQLGQTRYEWDAAHRLVRMSDGAVHRSFSYDGESRIVRIVERVRDADGMVTSDKGYLWCGLRRCLERDNTEPGAPVSKRYFDQGVIDRGQPLYYAQDALGSVRQVIDANSVVQARYDFEPFGERSRTAGSGNMDSDLGFAGLYQLPNSDLSLAVYRGYDAQRGRWLNRDPIGEAGGLNLFGYVAGNPLSRVDPLGLQFAPTPWGPMPLPPLPGSGVGAATPPEVALPKPRQVSPLDFIIPGMIGNLCQGISDWMLSTPPLPTDLVGDQSDPRAGLGRGGKKHTSGPLTPANGGTGDFGKDLDKLTGGTRPWQPGDSAPPGSLVGPNGIFGRPANSSGGSSIDIPGNGNKPHETLHY